MSENEVKGKSKKTYRGQKSLGHVFNAATHRAFARRGFSQSKIITEWRYIVGEALARFSRPQRIASSQGATKISTLYIEVYHGGIALELQHMQSVIIEKIARYFGYQAISQIRIIQSVRPIDVKQDVYKKRNTQLAASQLTESEKKTIDKQLVMVDNQELRDALYKLAEARIKREKLTI